MNMVDKTKLTRDYETTPLKRGEILPEDDLRYLFIDLNLSTVQIGKFLGKNAETVRKWTLQYNLKKDIYKVRESAKKTYKEKTGYDYAMQNPEIIKQREQNCLDRTGYKHPMQNPKNKCNFRDNHPLKTVEGKSKVEHTMKERYGGWYVQTDEFKEKAKQTLIDSVGVDNAMKCEEYRNKYYETCLQKYGNSIPYKTDMVKGNAVQHFQEKFQADNSQQNKEVHQKTLNTSIEKYGDMRMFDTDSFKEVSLQICIEKYGYPTPSKSPIIKEKTKRHNLEKYGMEWAIPKIMETKRKNKSFNKSKIEKRLFELLLLKFPNTCSPYSEHPIYTFACDYYIPELDLLIEYNGIWTHGKEPFDSNNPEHIEKLRYWKERALTSNYYKNAIYTWTDLDVRKQNIARDYKLNYLVFYTEKEFMEWYITL